MGAPLKRAVPNMVPSLPLELCGMARASTPRARQASIRFHSSSGSADSREE